VDSADRVIRAKLVAALITLGKDTPVKTVTLDSALKHLELARILRISTNDAVGFNFDSVQTFTLKHMQVEYRSSDANPVLIPWYNIQATATITTDQPPITIDFLLPAVPLEVLAN
jgi:hypothetical protein